MILFFLMASSCSSVNGDSQHLEAIVLLFQQEPVIIADTCANAYNFVHLDFRTGKGVVFLRCWNWRDKWREDIDSCAGGKFEFRLPGLAADHYVIDY